MTSTTRFGGFFISCSPINKNDKPYMPPSNCYQGMDLKPHPGLPASRFYAFTQPRRVGGHLYYPVPARRLEPFPA